MIDLAPKNCKIFTDNIEPEALEQIETLVNHPAFEDTKVRIMPDVHSGKGCVIGFTADLGQKVVPNLVGVDICCGMFTVPIHEKELTTKDFEKLDNVINTTIPSGMNIGDTESKLVKLLICELECNNELKNVSHLVRSLGTLGGGNHFIEIDKSHTGQQYLVVHTGSRNLGKQICEIYQNKAIRAFSPSVIYADEKRQLINRLKEEGRHSEIADELKKFNEEKMGKKIMPDELCYLVGKDRDDYIHDSDIARIFSHNNRLTIAEKIFEGMGWEFDEENSFETLHNYVDSQSGMIRKGAVSAQKDERLLIPLNMAEGSLICSGKGNEDWNCSAPHGAGRVLSRGQARRNLDMEEYKEKMNGIYTSCICEGTIDESPMAYKTAEDIVDNIKDTATIIDWIRPVYNYKAIDDRTIVKENHKTEHPETEMQKNVHEEELEDFSL